MYITGVISYNPFTMSRGMSQPSICTVPFFLTMVHGGYNELDKYILNIYIYIFIVYMGFMCAL